MKPVWLEMIAFGSYKEKTTVDFGKLRHSLYLITGDTGAGKTTIFDGIMVALYGVASGKGDKKSRTFEIMHCDYVEKSEDTTVTLCFEHMGKTYKVQRTLHFRKKRGTGDYEKTTPQAKLWEPDRDVLEKAEQVTQRITQILGMNAEQFRKTTMLAQGEFKKFLDADSEEKNKILGELFDSSAYVYLQDLFDEARKKLERDRREKGTEQIRRAMENFVCPQEASDAERERYCAGHSRLEEALCELVHKDGVQREEWKRKEEACREQDRKLHEKKGRAEEQNRLLEELAEKECERETLVRRKDEMEALKAQAEKAERAFYRLKPLETSAKKAAKNYEEALKSMEETEKRFQELEEEKGKKKEALTVYEQTAKPQTERLSTAINSMEKAIPRYGELEKNLEKQGEEQQLAQEARDRRQTAEGRLKQIEEELDAWKEEIRELDGVEAERERLKGVYEKEKERLDRLVSPGGIKEQTESIFEAEEGLKQERETLREMTAGAGEAEAHYHGLYQAFIEGQAGILARALEKELEEKEEAACPVCSTMFHRSQIRHFAKPGEKITEKKEVDAARKLFDDMDGERQRQSQRVTEKETAIREKKAGVISRLQELEPTCKDWETVCAERWLEETETRCRQQEEKAAENFRTVEKRSRRLIKLREKVKSGEEESASCRQAFEESRESEREHTQTCEKLKAAAEELIRSLEHYGQCPDRESAVKQKEKWEQEKKQLQQEMERAAGAYKEAERQCEETRGTLRKSHDDLPGLLREKRAAQEKLEEGMRQNGFAGVEEIAEILQVTGNSDDASESWLREKKEALGVYENALQNVQARIAELKEKTKEWERTDLTALDAAIARQGEMLAEIQSRSALFEKLSDNHRQTADTVQRAGRRLKETQTAWERLDSLANLANGTNAAGGRLSFDRYVMGYVFREVLEMANRRLDLMSGGRYELRHEMQAGRENAIAGLEVSVFDMTTGRCRPSQSLSGGESFFVSLALALGLSDVVQNHAGGRQLDTLFIDEGFGSLDSDVLDRAMTVLNQLTEGNRLVGIISHVARLEESIPQQIRVKNGEKGSSLEIVC
ncbi:MAG: SMC family ATPase [Lachnospiraceae bacterium]|nr:SMC family ATPase [Lachnospiraceae bacterium]